ncbi:MAG: tetrahydromethanopterin S-methyltransferase subunit H [Candidatus Heimdallarchaeota archaeon]
MFSFEKKIQAYNIGGIKVGGELGKNPTVLFGSMFYTGHRIVEDRSEGRFDRKRAEILINRQEELSDQTGIPGMLDLVAVRPHEFETYINFVTNVTDMPFAVDAWHEETKLAAAQIIYEQGLQNRTVYNSLAPWSKNLPLEVAQLSKFQQENVVLVAFNQEDATVQGRLSILTTKLIPYARKAGFQHLLVDTSVMNAPSTAISLLTGCKIRDQIGFPVGCGPSNGTDPKAWSIPREKWGKLGFTSIDAALHAVTTLWSDFLFYGPIENAKWIFPAVSLAEMLKATFRAELTHDLPQMETHPLNKFFLVFATQLKESFNGN